MLTTEVTVTMKNDQKFSARRRSALRKSLKGMAATGIVAGTQVWKKPIVGFVTLPVHAQTSAGLTVTRLRVSSADAGDGLLAVNDPAPGTNVGTISGADDTGAIVIRGLITPPPAPGTQVQISGVPATAIDNGNVNCIFNSPPNPCPVSVPVDTTNGEFSLNTGIEGLDDGSNTYTLTFSVVGLPDTVIAFNVEP